MLSPRQSTVSTRPRSSTARTLAVVRSCRVHDAGMGGLVQYRRLLEQIGNIPPAEAEERYYAMTKQPAMAA